MHDKRDSHVTHRSPVSRLGSADLKELFKQDDRAVGKLGESLVYTISMIRNPYSWLASMRASGTASSYVDTTAYTGFFITWWACPEASRFSQVFVHVIIIRCNYSACNFRFLLTSFMFFYVMFSL